ncbi:MAG: cytochrome C [Betaproteobacteria bacterium]
MRWSATMRVALAVGCGALSGVIAMSASAAAPGKEQGSLDRGRYVVRIAGCNDCHTPGYAEYGGKVPEKDWLVGDRLGWKGPWGTTYPVNLRQYMSAISEADWIKIARTKEMRPPMPWFALRAMSTDDLRALYRLIRHLGPVGEPAPAYLPPGTNPTGPYVTFP